MNDKKLENQTYAEVNEQGQITNFHCSHPTRGSMKDSTEIFCILCGKVLNEQGE